MTLLLTLLWDNYSRAAARVRSRAATYDVTEEEVMACEKYRCRLCGRIITDSREKRLLQSDATT